MSDVPALRGKLRIILHVVNLALCLIRTNHICATALHWLLVFGHKIQPLLIIRSKIQLIQCLLLQNWPFSTHVRHPICWAADFSRKRYVNVSTSTFGVLWNCDRKCNHLVWMGPKTWKVMGKGLIRAHFIVPTIQHFGEFGQFVFWWGRIKRQDHVGGAHHWHSLARQSRNGFNRGIWSQFAWTVMDESQMLEVFRNKINFNMPWWVYRLYTNIGPIITDVTLPNLVLNTNHISKIFVQWKPTFCFSFVWISQLENRTYTKLLKKIGPWRPELIWHLATKYKMGRQHVAPTVYHHLNHDKWGWDGYGVTDITWQS